MKRLRSFGWLSSEEIFRLTLSLAVTVLVARHLGPARFGALSYLLGIVAMLAPFTVMGLESIVMRLLVVTPADRDPLLGTALVIRIAGAVAGFGLVAGFIAVAGGPEGVTVGLALVAAFMLPCMSAEAFNVYFRATERMAWIAVPRIAVRVVFAAVAVWLVVSNSGLSGFVALRGAETLALGLAATAAYGWVTGALRGLRFDAALIRSLLRDGTPLFLSAFAAILYMRVDQVMLGQLASAEELGRYSVAVRFSDMILFVPMIAQSAFYAGLVRIHATDPQRFDTEIQHYYDVVALVMLGLALAIAAGASILLVPLFGAAYAPAVPMVWILAASLPFVGIGVARGTMLTIRGWLWTAPLTTAIGLVVNVGLNLLLIPAWGGIGAAAATVASYWLAAHGSCFLVPWLRPTGHDLMRALNPLGSASRALAHLRPR